MSDFNNTTDAGFVTARGPVAALTNVGLCMTAMERSINAPGHLPRIVAFYGPSGWGKSRAAARVAIEYDAYYVECRALWGKKATLKALLSAMDVQISGHTIDELLGQVALELATSRRPLIIDECDQIVDHGMIEMLRDIYEMSQASIMLIGEERLPIKLAKSERLHGRVLDWTPAVPVGIDDARHLRDLYATDVPVAEDVLGRIVEIARGSARRVAVNLERTQEIGMAEGWDAVTLARWGDRAWYTGEAPKRAVRS